MRPSTRRAIAYVAGRLATGRNATNVYDHDEGQYFNFRGSVGPGDVNVFDEEEACTISGSASGTSATLQHQGNRAGLSLTVNGDTFQGRDEQSGQAFSGRFQGNTVWVQDTEYGRQFGYSI